MELNLARVFGNLLLNDSVLQAPTAFFNVPDTVTTTIFPTLQTVVGTLVMLQSTKDGDTECYPYIVSIVSWSPAPKVSALPSPDAVYVLKMASLNVTCSPDTVAVACAVTTDQPSPDTPVTVCVPSDVGIMPCCLRPKTTITDARFLRPGTVTVPLYLMCGVAKTRDTECYPLLPCAVRHGERAHP